MKEPKAYMSSKTYCFGLERVALLSQMFRTFSMLLLLRLTMFGKDYLKINDNEKIYRTKRVTFLHISSQKRMCELFTLAGRCLVEFDTIVDGIVRNKRMCSRKVDILINNKHILGYILEDTNARWKIHLVSNEIIWLNKLKYNEEVHNMNIQFQKI